jgi:DNA-binding response OmpR family regulator
MNILLLDDDVVILSLLQKTFVKWGHLVVTYSDPDQCPLWCSLNCPCSLFKKGCPDCILTDVKMINVNGVKFIEELKRKGCRCQKIGIMSGDWNEFDYQKAIRLGATIFTKPFALQSLRSWLSEEVKIAA